MNTAPVELTSVDDAVDFLKSQGFEINLVAGVYRIRKEGWSRLPYGVTAKTLIDQANLIKGKLNAQRSGA